MALQEIQQEGRRIENQKPAPWGFWATIGFSCIIGVVYVLVQTIVVLLFIFVARLQDEHLDIFKVADSLKSNGFCLAIATSLSAPFSIGLTVLFVKIHKQITIKEYFCLHTVGWKELGKWVFAVVLFVACHDILTFLLGRPILPEFMISAYKTAYFMPLLWLALVIVAPLVEEIFFRGFLFKGIESSRMGPAGAVIITSLAWSVMHVQYDIYSIASLFLGGLLLGLARLKTHSIFPPIAMHILQNIIATIEVVIYLRIVPNGV